LERKNIITIVLVVAIALIVLNLDNITGKGTKTGTVREPTDSPRIEVTVSPGEVPSDSLFSVTTPSYVWVTVTPIIYENEAYATYQGFDQEFFITRIDENGLPKGRDIVQLFREGCSGQKCKDRTVARAKVLLGGDLEPGTYAAIVHDYGYQQDIMSNLFEIGER
jgi:hypothetical protein